MKSADQLKVVDDKTFQVTLPAANRFAVAVFSIPFAAIINSKLARQNATAQDPWANEWLKRNAAGGGAYKIESFRNDQVLLSRNDDWVCGPKPAMQQVIFQTVPEASTRGALVERDAADIAIEIPPNDFAAILERGAARALAIPMRNHMDFVAMNSQMAPFSDVRVRQAIAYALPYEQIFQSVFRSRGAPLYGGKGRSAARHLSASQRVQSRSRQGQGAAQGRRVTRKGLRQACSTAPARRRISIRSRLPSAMPSAKSAFD